MKQYLLAGVAAIAMMVGGSAAVRAADLPAPEVPMIAAAPPAIYDWTGFYIGANVGYGFGKFDGQSGARQAGFKDKDFNGIAGGAQIGGNWQWDKFVAGLETDIQGTGFDSDNGKKFKPDGGIFGTVRGRVGFAFDRFLVYGTGGFAYSDINIKANGNNNDDDIKIGWTAGGGVEAAVTDNISVKVEYLFADLGDGRVHTKNGDNFKFDYTQNLVRVGVNYKF